MYLVTSQYFNVFEMRKYYIILTMVLVSFSKSIFAQFIPYNYDSALYSWDSEYESYRVPGGMWFRMIKPDDFDLNRSEKYPFIIFFHGSGEAGTDNAEQLKHGGRRHKDAVLSGEFPGIVVYPQQTGAHWGNGVTDQAVQIIEEFIQHYNVDPNRIYAHGLSGGGHGAWNIVTRYPKLIAAALPMSAAGGSYLNDNILHIPLWYAQGSRDRKPSPNQSILVVNWLRERGASVRYEYMKGVGHGTWNRMYSKDDFFTWMLDKSKLKIHPFYEKESYCPGEPIEVRLGITGGFNNYEWAKDNISNIIASGTNEIVVTQPGNYYVRFARGSDWTEWSEPININNNRTPSPQPSITSNNKSVNLPALDGSNEVTLSSESPSTLFNWRRDLSVIPDAVDSFITVSEPGAYTVAVKNPAEDTIFFDNTNNDNITYEVPVWEKAEPEGCLSDYSSAIAVTTDNGAGSPAPPSKVSAFVESESSIELQWKDNASNELNYEVYRTTQSGGSYDLLGLFPAHNSNTPYILLDENLLANTTYYYVIRAVNENGGSAYSSEVFATTTIDNQVPTTPILSIGKTSSVSIDLFWSESDDNVGILEYEVFQNGVSVGTTEDNSITILSVTPSTQYSFSVKAIDLSGNESSMSNMVTAASVNSGLVYSYYHHSNLNTVDNIQSSGTLIETGNIENFDISIRQQDNRFAFIFDGFISIPTQGTYTFYLSSDDGSKLYIDNAIVVDHDGNHGCDEKSGSVTLSEGTHEIKVLMFENSVGECLEVKWSGPGINKEFIPDNVLKEDFNFIDGPTAISNLQAQVVSHNQINLTWQDNSTDETGFEIYRKAAGETEFVVINVASANTTSFNDTGLQPSTTYEYMVRAVNLNGGSPVPDYGFAAHLRLNNNYDDDSGNGIVSPANGNITFVSADKQEGSHAAQFNDGYIDLDDSNNFIHDEFSTRSVSMWIKASSINPNQIIFDEGGSTNGFAIRINNAGDLEAAVANSNDLKSISTDQFTANTWHHVAVVFHEGALRLYLDGIIEAENANVGYSKVGSHGDAAGLGKNNGSNAFDDNGNPFIGLIDYFTIHNTAISLVEIENLRNNSLGLISATTGSAPSAPAVPQLTSAIGISDSRIDLVWTDNSSTEIGFEIYRSLDENVGYNLIHTTNENVTTYSDNNLYGNTEYFYKIRAASDYLSSGFSNIVGGTTSNNSPSIQTIIDRSVQFGTSLQFDVEAEDQDGDIVSFTASGLPSFATITDNLNNTATLVFNAPESGAAEGFDITITVDDGSGGVTESNQFTISLNNNEIPVINSIGNKSMEVAKTLTVPLTASDDGGVVQFDTTNIPSFATSFVDNGNGSGSLTFNPGLNDFGIYKNLSVIADDGSGGIAVQKFDLTVTKLDENFEVNVNFTNATAGFINGWNNTGDHSQSNDLMEGLIDDEEQNTGINLRLFDQNQWKESQVSASTSTLYPQTVVNSFYASSWDPNNLYITLENLNPLLTYNIEIFASQFVGNTPNPSETRFTIGNEVIVVNTKNNEDQLVRFNGITPDVDNRIRIKVKKISGNSAYINAMIIKGVYNDGTAPQAPSDLQLTAISNSIIELSWSDNSFTEEGFEVLRATSSSGPYQVVASLEADITSYEDSDNITGARNYFYKIKAFNNNGESFSAVENVITPNGPPIINSLPTIVARANESVSVTITASDLEGQDVSFTSSGMPGFANLTDNGDGTATLDLNPGMDNTGFYGNIAISANDILNATSTTKIKLFVVTEKLEELVFINFTNTLIDEGEPFNNISTLAANTLYDNLLNDSLEISHIQLEILNGWSNSTSTGMNTGNNEGTMPDSVLISSWTTNSNASLKFLNLDQNSYYNFTFLNSEFKTGDFTTEFTIDGATVSLDAFKNVNRTVKLTGIQPDSNGEIEVSISAPSNSQKAILNATVVEKHNNPALVAPSDLLVEAVSKTEIQLYWTDNAVSETGFEIYRFNRTTGINQLVTTTVANVQSYADQNLTPNTTYDYRVRAINSNSNSDYSNVAFATTFEYIVYINVNQDTDDLPGQPWNNLSTPPEAGAQWLDFKNDSWQNTQIDLTLDTWETAATNVNGDSPGIFPDEVMRTYYYFNAFDPAVQFSLKGLNSNKKYNLVFFGSRVKFGPGDNVEDGTTRYIHGSDTVYLDAYGNKNQTVALRALTPDDSGNIVFYIASNDSQSQNYGFLNAMLVQVYQESGAPAPSKFRYYAKNNSDISDPNNWTSNPDGTGTSPASLSMDGITYNVPDNRSVSISNAIAINGSGSKIVVGNNANLDVANDIGTISLTSLELNANGEAELQTNGNIVDLVIGDDGLILHDNSVLKVGNNNVTVSGKGYINANNESGAISINGGNININSTTSFNSYLSFVPAEDTIDNLTINYAAAKVVLTNQLKVKDSVNLEAGTLTSNGNLLLTSDTLRTARIGALGANSTIEGAIEIQRDISNKAFGFYLLGTAIKGKSLEDISDDIWIQGVDGHQFPTSWPNVQTYDEATSSWQSFTGHTDALAPGTGLLSFLFSKNFTDGVVNIDYVGDPIIGSGDDNTFDGTERFQFPVSYSGADHGWNLLANPYPSQIYWEDEDWIKTNINGAVYVYDNENFSYVTYSGGVGTGGFDGNIASGQGFFVQANGANPELSITEGVKTGYQATFYRRKEITDVLSVAMINENNVQDETLIRISEDASFTFEPSLDAIKLRGSAINISSVDSAGNDLVINTIPDFKRSIEIPLNVSSKTGIFQLAFKEKRKITKVREILLDDKFLQQRFKVDIDSIYHFTITDNPASQGNDRFVLILKSSYEPLVNSAVTNIDGIPISQVKIESSSSNQNVIQEVNEYGFVDMRIKPETDYTIKPLKESDHDQNNFGINVRDILLAHQYINKKGQLKSAYSTICIDVDQNRMIEVNDLKLLESMVLNSYVPEDRWKFIEKSSFGPQNPLAYNEYILLNLYDDKIIEFTGLKVGDVDDSYFVRALNAEEKIKLFSKAFALDNDLVNVNFELDRKSDIAGLQFKLQWDTRAYEFTEILASSPGIRFNSSRVANGELTVLFYHEDAKTMTMEQLSNTFSLQMRQLDDPPLNMMLKEGYESVAVASDLSMVPVELAPTVWEERSLQLLQNYPNPFKGSTTIPFIVSKAGYANIRVINSLGSVVYESNVSCETGYNEVEVELAHVKSILICQITFDNEMLSKKMIVR